MADELSRHLSRNYDEYAAICHVDDGHPQGDIAGVLIFQRPAFPVDWLYAAIFPHYTFEKQEELGMPLDQYNQIVRRMKHDANTIAAAIALEKAGLGRGVILSASGCRCGQGQAVRRHAAARGSHRSARMMRKVHRTDELMQVISGLEPGRPPGGGRRAGGGDTASDPANGSEAG